jgi:hypothetical protein
VTDEVLHRARDRVRRLEQVRRLRAAAMDQLADVERELAGLRRVHAAEERDVDKLDRRTLTSIVAGALGTRDERLAKERAEADLARLRVEGQDARLRQLTADLAALDHEMGRLADSPRQYDQALVDAEHTLRAAGDPRAATLTQVAVRIADIVVDLREYREAQRAGEAALAAVAAVLKPLGAAQGWSTVDMVGGSFADLVEHDKLGRAQNAAWYAQQALDRFAREMADIGADVRPRLPHVDTRWFADVFFDNIITDALKHRRIARTYEETAKIARWLQSCIAQLEQDRAGLASELGRLRGERERLHGLV